MKKGTIIYVGNFELPDKGASAHRVVANGKIFTELGYKVIFLGVNRDENFGPYMKVSSFDESVFEELYPRGTKQWFEHIYSTKNIDKLVSDNTDTVMILLYNTPYILLAAVRRKYRHSGIKVCYDCTEWNDYTEGNIIKRLYKKLDAWQIENLLAKKAEGIIAISNRMVSKYKDTCRNLVKLPPLVDIKAEKWQQERRQREKFTFCYAGSPSNKERVDLVVDSFIAFDNKDAALQLVGITKDEFVSFYGYDESRLEGHDIKFMGIVPHIDSLRYVLSCDCYIFLRESTNRNEAGFPTKFAESFTCGVPIISTDVSDIKSFMTEERGIILNSVKPDEIVAAMKKVMSCYRQQKNIDATFDYRNYIEITDNWLKNL